jgi:hypothetical protein
MESALGKHIELLLEETDQPLGGRQLNEGCPDRLAEHAMR